MNINEQLLDLLLKRDLLLQRVSNGLSKEVALYYTDLIKQAINTIKDYDEITIVKMNKLIKEIDSRIEFNYEEQLANKFQELGVVEASYIPSAINGLIGVNIVDKLLPEPLIQRIINNSYLADGLTIAESFEKLNDNLKNTFQSQIRLSVLNGETNQQIIKTLKPILNEFTTNKIDSLVKTAVSTVANNTRMEIYKENEDIFKGYQHQSVLDSRTTLQCATRDGAYWDLEHKGINDKGKQFKFLVPPLHFRCRSLLLPILKSFKDLGLDLDEVTGLTRSSINGEVPRETNFDKWFSSKDKAFQEFYLGKGRYELYKDGKISLSDLVNQKGETLAIKDLNKVSGVDSILKVAKVETITKNNILKEVINDTNKDDNSFNFLSFLSQSQNEKIKTPEVNEKRNIINNVKDSINEKINLLSSKVYKKNDKTIDYGENAQLLTGKTKGSIENINNSKKQRTLQNYDKQIKVLESIENYSQRGYFENINNDILDNFMNSILNVTPAKDENLAMSLHDIMALSKDKLEYMLKKENNPLQKKLIESIIKIK